MAEVIEVGLKVTGAKEAQQAVAGVAKETKTLGTGFESVSKGLDKMTGGAVTGFRNAAGGVKTFIKGLKATRAAIIATGVGALVLAVIALVSAFAGTSKGAAQLKKVMAGLGAVLDNVKQRFSAVGGFITGLFTGGPEKALENYNDLTEGLATNLADVYKQASLLEQASQDLRNTQRDLSVTFAESRAQVKEYNKIAEDTTKGIDERIAASQKANQIESDLMAARQAAATEELRIAQERDAMGDSSAEDLDNLAQLEIKLINIRTESAEMQTTLQNRLNLLRAEDRRVREENAAKLKEEQEAELERLAQLSQAEQDRLNAEYLRQDQLDLALESQQEQEVTAVVAKYEKLFALSDEFGYGEAQLKEKQKKELAAIDEKYATKEVVTNKLTGEQIAAQEAAKRRAIMAGRQALISGGMQVLQAGAKTAKQQKKLAVAQVLLSQGQAMANAVAGAQASATATGPGAIFTAPGFTATAIGMVLGTFGQIKSILEQADASTSGIDTNITVPQGGGGGAASAGGSTPQFDQALLPSLDDLIAGQTGGSFQAYVVQSQLADQQALSNQLALQSTL